MSGRELSDHFRSRPWLAYTALAMSPELVEQILSPLGIAACLAALALLLALLRALLWRLFAFDKILQQKKSAEVRMGKIAETLSPVLDNFPIDIRKAGTSTVFLGQPVDYMHFDPEEGITFIEIKSGEAKLSASQRKLKSLVQKGKVRWIDFQVD